MERSGHSFMLRTRTGILRGAALLRDMFLSVSNKTNGFEHNLRTGRYTRSAADRHRSTDFSQRQHGAKERMRRLKQLDKRLSLRVEYVGPSAALKGAKAGAVIHDDGRKVSIFFDEPHLRHANGSHNAAHWAVIG